MEGSASETDEEPASEVAEGVIEAEIESASAEEEPTAEELSQAEIEVDAGEVVEDVGEEGEDDLLPEPDAPEEPVVEESDTDE